MNDGCPLPLTCFASGTCVRLAFAALGVGECERLGAMGLCEGARCTILHNTDKLIVRVGESRFGVSREVAAQLFAHQDAA
jgi:Fe2+ transport system protein FeoA